MSDDIKGYEVEVIQWVGEDADGDAEPEELSVERFATLPEAIASAKRWKAGGPLIEAAVYPWLGTVLIEADGKEGNLYGERIKWEIM